MRRTGLRLVVAALVAGGIPIHVLGQERGAEPAPLSVSGSVLWSIQPEGTYSGSPHNIDALGGTTVGGAVSLAIGVSRFASIDVGVRVRGPISQDNGVSAAASVWWRETHREVALDTAVVFPLHSDRAFHVEPSLGVTFLRGITDRTDVVFQPFLPEASAQHTPDETLIDKWFGLASGLDGVFTVTPRAAVVPSLRLYWVPGRNQNPVQGSPNVRLSNVLCDVGVGLRVSF